MNQRIREATYLLAAIAACMASGAALYLFMVPIAWFWFGLACGLMGAGLMFWIFRDRILHPTVVEVPYWSYECPPKTVFRFRAQPDFSKDVELGVEVLGVDDAPRPVSYEESFSLAQQLWIYHGRNYSIDVVRMPSHAVKDAKL